MAARKRKQSQPSMTVADLHAANQVLGEIAQLQRSLHAIEADMHASIDKIKQSALAFAAPRRARLARLARGLSAFAETHKESLFAKRRGVELACGALGFRRSSRLKPQGRGSWDQVLDRIKELGATEALRIREDVNREALRGWPDARLQEVGVNRVEQDLFWYEVKLDLLHHRLPRMGDNVNSVETTG
ncbi:MAG: host-nuclease inhibitor protein Gam [Magnetococcales bacterium]|nr:host-nuclease inhibitor protein Gam [Magnetococcales bacterium]